MRTYNFAHYLAAFIDGLILVALLDATGITGALWLILFVIGCIIPGPCEIAFRLYMYTCMTHRAELYTRYGRTYTQRCSTLA